MEIAFHIGANCTDEDRILKSLLRNADILMQQGVAVPGPSKYRSLIRETIQGLDGSRPAPGTRDILIDAIVENDDMDRLVMSNDNFICVPNRIFDHGIFYPQAEGKAKGLRDLFPDDDLELYLGIRNPVTFLEETLKRARAKSLDDYLGVMAPEEIRWSDVVRRLKSGAPDVPLTVWCNEDTPILWETLIRRLSGVAGEVPLLGALDMISAIISPEGLGLLKAELQADPPQTPSELHLLFADFLEEHALEEEVEDTIDIADLGQALIEEMTQVYEDDLAVIAAFEGVELVLPDL